MAYSRASVPELAMVDSNLQREEILPSETGLRKSRDAKEANG